MKIKLLYNVYMDSFEIKDSINKISYSYETVYDIDFRFSKVIYLKFKNFKYGNFEVSNELITKVEGNTFIVRIDEPLYLHLLVHQLSYFEILKKEIPDLKVIFISFRDKDNLKIFLEKNLFLKDLFLIYKKEMKDVYFVNESCLFFENLFSSSEGANAADWLTDSGKIDLKNLFSKNESLKEDYFSFFKSIIGRRMIYFSIFLKQQFLQDKKQSPKKIYISRKRINIFIKEQVLNFFETLEQGTHPAANVLSYPIRYYPPKEEEKIEKFFKKLGYTTVYLEDFGLIEQANLFYNATHIAGLNGTAFINSYFCKAGTKIFLIDTAKGYVGWGQEAYENLDFDVYKFPSWKDEATSRSMFMAENILEDIKGSALDLIYL